MSTSPSPVKTVPAAPSENSKPSAYRVSTAVTPPSWTPFADLLTIRHRQLGVDLNSAASVGQGAKKGKDATFLKIKFSFDWISPFTILAVDPAAATVVPISSPFTTISIVRHARARLHIPRLRSSMKALPTLRRHSRPNQTSSGRPHQVRAQLLLTSPHPSTSWSTKSQHRQNASRQFRLLDINSFTAGEVLSPSCTKRIRSNFSACLGDTIGAYCTTGATSFAVGRAPLRSTAILNAYTARCASGPHTANYRDPEVKSTSLPGTASSHAPSGFTVVSLLLFRPGHTSDTRSAMVPGGWAK